MHKFPPPQNTPRFGELKFTLHQQWRKLALTTDNLLFNIFLINIKIYVRLFCCALFFFFKSSISLLFIRFDFLFYLVNVVVI